MTDREPAWVPPRRGRILVPLSGGVDSAYAAWRVLKDGHKALLFHVNLHNREGRGKVEKQATDRICRWLVSKGLNRFDLVDATFDYGTMPRIVYDVELVGFMSGMVLSSRAAKDCNTVVVASNTDDPTVRNRTSRRGVNRKMLCEQMAGRELNWWWLLRAMSKAQVVAATPPGLLELCWWCRTPRDAKPCHRCPSCKQVDAARERIPAHA